MAMSLEERADPSHGMLIVVDMQNDFCHRQGAACKRGRDMDFVQKMIPRLIRLVEQAREHNFPDLFRAHIRQSMDQLTGMDRIQKSRVARLRRRQLGRRISRRFRTATG